MATATLSSKYQITIPAEARAALGLEAGRKLEVRIRKDRIELVPVRPTSAFRGFLKGKLAGSRIDRDADRKL
jgi:AbrB family looped-hinge helix DNA binding protein